MSEAQITALIVLGFTLFGCAIVAVIERSATQRKRWTIAAFDPRKCERCGSQGEWNRRVNARFGR